MPRCGLSCAKNQRKERRRRAEAEFDSTAGDFTNPLGTIERDPHSAGSTFTSEGDARCHQQPQAGSQGSKILKQGWLTKRGQVRKNWKRRWFVLWSSQQITYHASPGAPTKGLIALDHASISLDTIATGRENCFGLFVSGYSKSGHSERRLYLICAETPDEVSQWVRLIKRSVAASSSSQPLATTTDALSVFELINRARTLGIANEQLSTAMGRDDLVVLLNDALARQRRAVPLSGLKARSAPIDGSSPFVSAMFVSAMHESVDSIEHEEQTSNAATDLQKLELADPELHSLWVGLAESDLLSARSVAILRALEDHGLQPDDPRVSLDCALLQRHSTVSLIEFRCLVTSNIVIDRALHGRLVVADFPSFRKEIEAIKLATEPVDTGKVATYIPQLARVDPNQYGVAVCTIDGQQSFCGDYDIPFSVQSTMKPLAYAVALEEHGERVVHRQVGREPSGLNFNHRILNEDDLPHNPMINAGAIMVSSLVRPDLAISDRFDAVMEIFTRLAGGRRPGFAQSTYLSEKATADRNFSLLYMMKEVGGFAEGTNVEEALDFYLMLCSIELDCRTMAIVAGTLANGGVNPLTGDRIFNARAVRNTLSLMASCGMYDFSGEFAFRMGFPCKSGVSGSLCIVIPGITGMCAWSPALDELGNSTRGNAFCQGLVERFRFHMFDIHSSAAATSSDKIDLRENSNKYRDSSSMNSLCMHWAAANGQLDWLKQLIARGMNVDGSDHDGCTPMHLAAANGHAPCLEILMKENADDSLLNRFNQTAFQMALPGSCVKKLKAYKRQIGADVCQVTGSSGDTSSDGSWHDLDAGATSQLPQQTEGEPRESTVLPQSIWATQDATAVRSAFRHVATSTGETATATKVDLYAVAKTAGLSSCSRLKKVLSQLPDKFTCDEFVAKANDRGLLQILTGQLVIPAFENFERELVQICDRIERTVGSGSVSTVYPVSDVNSFSMAACTISGQRCSHGDCESSVVVAELSSVLNYCMVTDLLGADNVHRHVGHEPAPVGAENGLRDDGRPHNPCVPMGNLVTLSLVEPANDLSARLALIRSKYESAADGACVVCDEALLSQFLSGSSTESARTHSMAYHLLEKEAFPDGANPNVVAETLELYYRTMSTTMSTKALSVIAATLANGGINPCTEQRVFSELAVQNALSVMYCCGHKAASGEHAFVVGIPSAAASSGATLVCVPGVVGFCVHSPRLDLVGNSVGARAFAAALSGHFKFHLYEDHISTHRIQKLLVNEDEDEAGGTDVLSDPTESQTTAEQVATSQLLAAAADGNLPFIRRANTEGVVDILEARDYNGRTALHLAAAEGNAKVVRFLLAEEHLRQLRGVATAAINRKDRWGMSPRDQAAASNYDSVAKML